MADFEEAYKITSDHEGGYVNDPDDVGQETFNGVSRRYHPSWGGWVIIDDLKTKPNFPQSAYKSNTLDCMVRRLYKTNYWDVNQLDHLASQAVANEIYDTGINMGVRRAGKFLQRAVNLLNKNGNIYHDIVEDGVVGRGTMSAVNACLNYRGDEYLYKILNILQGNHYIEYMTKSPTQEKFAYGWLSRVDFLKK